MRIAVEAVGNRAGGGAMVLLAALGGFLEEPAIDEVTLFCSPREQRGFDLPGDPRLSVIELSGPDVSALKRVWWLEIELPKTVARKKLDRLMLMNAVGHAPPKCPSIAFVQQTLPLTEESRKAARSGARFRLETIRWLTRRGTEKATRVAVQRPGMRTLLVECFGLNAEKIDVFEPGPPPFPASEDLSGKLKAMEVAPRDCRILYVGSNESHKNLKLAAKAVQHLRQTLPGAVLFATCPPDASASASGGIHWLGFLNRGELRRAYELASVLVMPSRIESLGLPLLEAMSLGVPVVAADLPYARDVCGSAGLYFNADSSEDAAAKLREAMQNCEIRNRLTRAGLAVVQERAGKLPYREMARRLIELT